MAKRAVIYARVSSERQAGEDKVSIQEQVATCEKLCHECGYTVVSSYVDDKRYRVSGKMVEPSGTRKDRPQFQAMLKAAANGEFDVIVEWKEDRLARGIGSAGALNDVLDKAGVEVVNGTFDKRMFGILAIAAGWESDNIKQRMAMGVTAKLRRGEVWDQHRRYGYGLDDEHRLIPDEERAPWVRQIFRWYTERLPVAEIRRRLIAASAPASDRKSGHRKARAEWPVRSIQNILKEEDYCRGYIIARRNGQQFEIACPPLISRETFEKVRQMRQDNVSQATGPVFTDYLCRNLVYCTCGRKWSVRTYRYRSPGVLRKTLVGRYVCPGRNDAPYAYQNDDCPKTISARKLDGYVNRALNDLLLHPEEVARAIDEEIQRRGSDEEMVAYQVSVEQIEGELAAMPVQRDWVITMARTRKITDAEMEVQLRELEATKVALQKELREKQSPVENLNQLRELAKNIGEFLSRLDVEEDLL